MDWSAQFCGKYFQPLHSAQLKWRPSWSNRFREKAAISFPPADFLKRLRAVCDQHGIYLIFDEVQTGFGRTGQMFAAQTLGVRPDIMAIAKGIANGFPLGATVPAGS